MLFDHFLVAFPEYRRVDRKLRVRLEVLELSRIVELEMDLVRVQNVEDHHVVTAGPQRLDGIDHGLRCVVKIGDEGDHPLPPKTVRGSQERLDQTSLATLARLDPI